MTASEKLWADYHADVALMEANARKLYGRVDYYTVLCRQDRLGALLSDLMWLTRPKPRGLFAAIEKKVAEGR